MMLHISIFLTGQTLPQVWEIRDWRGLRAFLASSEFAGVASQVELLTVTRRSR